MLANGKKSMALLLSRKQLDAWDYTDCFR